MLSRSSQSFLVGRRTQIGRGNKSTESTIVHMNESVTSHARKTNIAKITREGSLEDKQQRARNTDSLPLNGLNFTLNPRRYRSLATAGFGRIDGR